MKLVKQIKLRVALFRPAQYFRTSKFGDYSLIFDVKNCQTVSVRQYKNVNFMTDMMQTVY